jgi:hypothetical protein
MGRNKLVYCYTTTTARSFLGAAIQGTQNLALGFGGYAPGASAATEEWTLGSSAAGTASTLTTS